MRFVMRGLAAVAILAVTLGALALAVWQVAGALEARRAAAAAAPAPRERVFAAKVLPVEPRTVEPEMVAYGEVRARRMLDIRAPRGGTVAWVAPGFEDGAAVAAGAVLLRLDAADQTAARDLRRADLAQAEADGREAARARILAAEELAAAERQAALRAQAAERQRAMKDRGIGSEAAVEAADLAAAAAEQAVLSRKAALAQAEARADQAATAAARARIALAEAERALADSDIRAEFAGRLSAAAVAAGAVVAPNERLAQIVDPASLEVAFRLSAGQFARIAGPDGTPLPLAVAAALDLGGIAVTAEGRITRAAPVVGEGQTGRLVYAALAGAEALRPGDFVTVTIREPALPGVAVLPAVAVAAGDRVLALVAGDRLEEVAVRILRRQGDAVLIEAAPLAGREVVAERTRLLAPGVRIRPLRPEAPAAPESDGGAMLDLAPDRRARLVAQVEGDARLPAEARARILAQLRQDRVPAALVARLEGRAGG